MGQPFRGRSGLHVPRCATLFAGHSTVLEHAANGAWRQMLQAGEGAGPDQLVHGAVPGGGLSNFGGARVIKARSACGQRTPTPRVGPRPPPSNRMICRTGARPPPKLSDHRALGARPGRPELCALPAWGIRAPDTMSGHCGSTLCLDTPSILQADRPTHAIAGQRRGALCVDDKVNVDGRAAHTAFRNAARGHRWRVGQLALGRHPLTANTRATRAPGAAFRRLSCWRPPM